MLQATVLPEQPVLQGIMVNMVQPVQQDQKVFLVQQPIPALQDRQDTQDQQAVQQAQPESQVIQDQLVPPALTAR